MLLENESEQNEVNRECECDADWNRNNPSNQHASNSAPLDLMEAHDTACPDNRGGNNMGR